MIYITKDGDLIKKETGQDKILKKIYGSEIGRLLIKPLTLPIISKIGGAFLSTPISKLFIKPFIKSNNIDMSEFEDREFNSYNDFFTRKIKYGKRKLGNADIISPCDGKVSAYQLTDDATFEIKNSTYSLRTILRSKKLADEFSGGVAVVIRLCVDNYHRYCYACDGKKSKDRFISGFLHTVNPVAFENVEIFKENSREYTIIKTDLDSVIQMEVGALMVGKISNNVIGPAKIHRGEEKGKFEFGGSTIVLFLQKDRELCYDFLFNTLMGYETLVQMGDDIAD